MKNEKQMRLGIWMPVFDGELINLPNDADLVKHDDDVFAAATKSGDYLSRVQLMTANSKECKENEFPQNHYAIIEGQNHISLGKDVDVLVVTWRPKAMEIGDEVMSIYDVKDPEFERIQLSADEKDSGCMFGPEFLLWIPSKKEFATFFMGSKSARREAPNVKALLKKAATLKSKLIKTKKYSWQAATVTPCSTPFDMPEMEALKETVEKFNNPQKSEVETADAKDAATQKRDR